LAQISIAAQGPLTVHRRVIPPNGPSIMHRSSRKLVHRLTAMLMMMEPVPSRAGIATTRLPSVHSVLLSPVLEIPRYQSIRAGLPLLILR
jgi:hypothetical protein